MIYVYHFDTVPELKRLLKDRMGDALSDRAVTEAVKETFRRKPRKDGPQTMETDEGRKVVDYIYQMYNAVPMRESAAVFPESPGARLFCADTEMRITVTVQIRKTKQIGIDKTIFK